MLCLDPATLNSRLINFNSAPTYFDFLVSLMPIIKQLVSIQEDQRKTGLIQCYRDETQHIQMIQKSIKFWHLVRNSNMCENRKRNAAMKSTVFHHA